MREWVTTGFLAAGAAALSGTAMAQQPAPPPESKAEVNLNAAWQQMVAAAETAAISGPDQLRAAKAAQDALRAWMAEQRQKLADQQKDTQAKLAGVEKDRQSLAAQVASLNKQLADAKKPTSDQKTIAQLNSRILELQHEADQADQCPHSVASDEATIGKLNAEVERMRRDCHVSSDLPHSTPAPGRK